MKKAAGRKSPGGHCRKPRFNEISHPPLHGQLLVSAPRPACAAAT